MALLRATVLIEYEVMPKEMLKNYGTTDPQEAAVMDVRKLAEDPETIGEMVNQNIDSTKIRVEVVIP